MARLKNPQDNRDAIRQDYRDKHSSGGALFAGRKYNRKVKNKDGEYIPLKDGGYKMYRPYMQLKQLITDEDMLVQESFDYSERLKNDCYCSINSFPANCDSRVADNVDTLAGFYLDFDHRAIHNLAKEQQVSELVEDALGYADQIVATLADYLPGDFGMPVISYTGGGYGFYFPLRPMPATEENKARYKEVHELLYRRFNILFEVLLEIFDNDHTVVGDIARVIRITGTYNDKTGAYARYIARYGNVATNEVYAYSLDDIISLYHLEDIEVESNIHLVSLAPLPNKREKERKAAKSKSAIKAISYTQQGNIIHPIRWYQGFVDNKQIGKYIELAITSLRHLDENGSLQRNNALFLIACLETEVAYAQYGSRVFGRNKTAKKVQVEIIHDIYELNNSLSDPLEDYELAAILNHALTNNYHFRKLSTIQKFLNLTDEEFAGLGWMDGKKRREQWQEHSDALTELDRDVIKLYLSGLSDAKIGKELNIPKLQSIRIRKRLGVMDRNAKWEDIDYEGNKRHLLNKTNKAYKPRKTPDVKKKLPPDVLRWFERRESIADRQICNISPAKLRDFIDKDITWTTPPTHFHYLGNDFFQYLLGLGLSYDDAKAIFCEKYVGLMNEYNLVDYNLGVRLQDPKNRVAKNLLNETNKAPDAEEQKLLDEIRKCSEKMERIGDSQICDISPAKFKDFFENPKDFSKHLLGLVDLEQAQAIFWEKYAPQINDYIRMRDNLKWNVEKLEAMRKEAAEKQAEKQAERAAKILRADDATWFCHEPKYNRRNHANLVVEEIAEYRDMLIRAYYV